MYYEHPMSEKYSWSNYLWIAPPLHQTVTLSSWSSSLGVNLHCIFFISIDCRNLCGDHKKSAVTSVPSLSSPSESWAGSASAWTLHLCSCTGHHAQTSPMFALSLCCGHLEIPNNCWTRGLVFSFALGPTNNVPVPEANASKQSILLFSQRPSNVSGKDQIIL